jgi:glycosyltransferase involved in cell wall biosynthesis
MVEESGCLISVVIPTFNRLFFLKEALTSVLNQTLLPKEIIIVDDGSTDGTEEWVREQAQTIPNIVILRQLQKGPAAARNLGAARATGHWIAFLDSDDLWQKRKLEVQMEFLQSNPDYKICQTEEIWIRKGVRVNSRKAHRKFSGFIFEHCLPLCIISPSAVIMERKFFLALGGFDEALPVCEDYEFWLRASLRSPVMTMPQPLTVKRGGHADQLSKKHWGMDRFRVQAMEKILREENLTPGQRALVLEMMENKLTILSEGFNKRHPGEFNPYHKKIRELKFRDEIDFGHAQSGKAAGDSGAA